ncbi:MAG: hypothetical protein ACTHQQ_14475 [Solirubrobacteraceae bacterium]
MSHAPSFSGRMTAMTPDPDSQQQRDIVPEHIEDRARAHPRFRWEHKPPPALALWAGKLRPDGFPA